MLAPCILVWTLTFSPPPINEAQIVAADLRAGQAAVLAADAGTITAGTRLVLTAGTQPVGWFTLVAREGGSATFAHTGPVVSAPEGPLRGWLIPPDAVARLANHLPADGSVCAAIDRVGPGARSVWIHAGSNQGVTADTSWWRRVGGQPVARFDVRLVGPEACFCSVVPLAANWPTRGGDRVTIWPSPACRSRGEARSAVAFVETTGDATIAWVAAPPHADCPPEPQVEFSRAGRFVAHGLVEARDELFWYVRLVATALGPQPTTRPSASSPVPASSQPATAPTSPSLFEPLSDSANARAPSCTIKVGDTAVIRTRADIQQRRFAARVFGGAASGAMINAGETDGARVGATGSLIRRSERIGAVRVLRVQRGYSIIAAAEDGDNAAPQSGDVVRFGPAPTPPTQVGKIEQIVGGTLFLARLDSDSPPPLMTPLAIRARERTVGVGVLLACEGSQACGFALEPSLTGPLQTGCTLVQTNEDRDRRSGQ